MSTPNVSLWDIESSVAQLIALLDEPDINPEEYAIAVQELERWVCAEVRKVDSIRALIRNCDQREAEALAAVAGARQEMERQRARAAVFANRRERVKGMALTAMGTMGLRKIEGKTGRLRIQGNGGTQKLNITNQPLIPDEYRVFSFQLSAKWWQSMQRILGAHGYADGELMRAMLLTATPSIDEAKVRAALEARCVNCGGGGTVEISDDNAGAILPCDSCNGTGKCRVPGSELETIGEHLRVE